MKTIPEFEQLATENEWYDCWNETYAACEFFMLCPEPDVEGQSFGVVRDNVNEIISFESWMDGDAHAVTIKVDHFKNEAPLSYELLNGLFELIKAKTPVSHLRRDYLKDYIRQLKEIAAELK